MKPQQTQKGYAVAPVDATPVTGAAPMVFAAPMAAAAPVAAACILYRCIASKNRFLNRLYRFIARKICLYRQKCRFIAENLINFITSSVQENFCLIFSIASSVTKIFGEQNCIALFDFFLKNCVSVSL